MDVQERRDFALKIAQELVFQNPTFGVRVIKETYQSDDGNFLSVKIFERGKRGKEKKNKNDSEIFLPCMISDDLYSYHTRETIARLLNRLLKRWQVTVSELMHRADLLEKLEATGTELQHAIQKYAIARSGNSNDPVHNIIRRLNDLIQTALDQVYEDSRNGLFPKIDPSSFLGAAKKLSKSTRAIYILSGAIAAHIANSASVEEKLSLLLELIEGVSGDDQAARLCLGAIDFFVSDIFKSPDITEAHIAEEADLGATLIVMSEVLLGRLHKSSDKNVPKGLDLLSKHIKADSLPKSKVALCQRILDEIRSTKRFSPESMDDEVAVMRELADRLVLGQGPSLSSKDITHSFSLRSRRLVSTEQIKQYLAGITDPEQKIRKLLALEKNIVGPENKRTLVSAISAVLQSHQFERHFLVSKDPALKRLARIAEMQKAVFESGIQSGLKEQLAGVFDLIASKVEVNTAFFEKIDRKDIASSEKAIAFLKLCGKDVLPEGDCKNRAKALALKYIQQPGFLDSYLKTQQTERSSQESRQQLELLRALLDEAGIEPARSLLIA